MKRCSHARERCSQLFQAAHDNDVATVRAASLEELRSQPSSHCFEGTRVEHLACMGGAFEVFCLLVEKGLTVSKKRVCVIRGSGAKDLCGIAEEAGCSRLVALLQRGVLKVPPPWATVRLLFIGRLDPECTFYGVSKDVARLLAKTMVEEIPFLEAE